MEKQTTELEYLEQIANIKWEKGYKCKTCKGKEYYNIKKNFARRCKACGYEETPIKNTMFENSKLSLQTQFAIFFKMQERMDDFIADKYYQHDCSSDDYFEGYEMRLTNKRLAEKFKINENSIALLFEKTAFWLKPLYKSLSISGVEEEFLKGAKDKKSRKIYECVYYFLMYCGEKTYMFPTVEQMIIMAVKKKVYYDWD